MSHAKPEQGPPEVVRKLSALANHPATPAHEAAAARAKLTAILTRLGLTESDISDHRRITWILRIAAYERELLMAVTGMLLDTYDPPVRFRYFKEGGKVQAHITAEVADKIDIEAAFGYYRKLLHQDRAKLKVKAAAVRKKAKALEAQARMVAASTEELPFLMRVRYRLYPPSPVAASAAGQQSEPGPEPELSPDERRELDRFIKRWDTARASMTKADSWRKGEGLETGVFALEG